VKTTTESSYDESRFTDNNLTFLIGAPLWNRTVPAIDLAVRETFRARTKNPDGGL